MFRLRFDEGGLANGVRPCGPSPHHSSTSHKLVISSRCRNGGRSWTRCLCRYYSDDAGCSAEANLDTDDWARRMEHRTAGIAAVKRRAKDSGLSRFERWAGSTGCPLRAGYMNPGAGRALRERCSTSSSIETMALLGVSTKCACVDKWLLHNGLAPMATVPSKSSVTLSTDLRGFFERRSSDGTRLAGVLVLVTVSAVAFEARGRGQSRARWVSLRVFPSGPWLPASAPRRRLRVSATCGSTSILCGRSWLIFRSGFSMGTEWLQEARSTC